MPQCAAPAGGAQTNRRPSFVPAATDYGAKPLSLMPLRIASYWLKVVNTIGQSQRNTLNRAADTVGKSRLYNSITTGSAEVKKGRALNAAEFMITDIVTIIEEIAVYRCPRATVYGLIANIRA
ncbi:hypothetical protein DBR18_11900 [Pseudomonas sp. HMWF021]|nr:hypothetical protein DBR18_11900 [Pseudomonas sp. HMWF021]